MDISSCFTTERLSIKALTINDDQFIFELLNTEGWIAFIGNRNIHSIEDARAYIQKIIAAENISYWVVQLKNTGTSIGLVTYIKRNYLEHHDIGFAFLPRFGKKGYAYEAAHALLHQLIQDYNFPHILATTVPENKNSVELLKKLGLTFEKEIAIEQEKLHVYGASVNSLKTSLINK